MADAPELEREKKNHPICSVVPIPSGEWFPYTSEIPQGEFWARWEMSPRYFWSCAVMGPLEHACPDPCEIRFYGWQVFFFLVTRRWLGGAHLEVVIAVFDTEGDSIGFSRWCLLDWDLTNCVSRTVVRILIAIRRVSWNVVWEHRVSFIYISRLRGRYAICCDNSKATVQPSIFG